MVNTEIRLIIFFAAGDGKDLYSQQKQDWELTVAQIMNSLPKFRLKLKKVGKNTRPVRYDLNQIPNNYMVEMTNRLKGSEELCAWSTWRTMEKGSWHCKEGGDTQEKEMQKVKKDVWGGLTNIWEKKKS